MRRALEGPRLAGYPSGLRRAWVLQPALLGMESERKRAVCSRAPATCVARRKTNAHGAVDCAARWSRAPRQEIKYARRRSRRPRRAGTIAGARSRRRRPLQGEPAPALGPGPATRQVRGRAFPARWGRHAGRADLAPRRRGAADPASGNRHPARTGPGALNPFWRQCRDACGRERSVPTRLAARTGHDPNRPHPTSQV